MTNNTIGNFGLPTAPQYHNYEELTFMKDQATPHVAFPFVCGFTVILLFGGLGVEDQGLHQTRSYYRRFMGELHQTEDT
jgi:hypothetical protein